VGEIETRSLILKRAQRLFLQRGYADVSVGEVADAVGVTKPTLYYHFGNKEALYAAVLVDLMREVGGHVLRVVSGQAPVRERLIDLVRGYFTHADATMEPLLRDTSELIGQEHAQEVRRVYQEHLLAPIEALMTEGIASGLIRELDPSDLVRALMGLLDAFTAAGGHLARTLEEHQAVAVWVVSLFLDGASPRP
jgi:AcrR family transcriptional regulator